LCALTFGGPASADSKLNARARIAMARLGAGGSPQALLAEGAAVTPEGALDVFIVGNVSRAELEAAGAHVRTELPGLFTADLPLSAVAKSRRWPT
jgi:hypothetical protein